MEGVSSLWQHLGKVAGVYLAVVAGSFVLIAAGGVLLHRNRVKALRRQRHLKK